MSNDLRSLLSALNDQGWEVDRTRSQQYRAKPPSAVGEIVIFSPDVDKQPRFLQNAIRDLRHQGFQWPPPPPTKTRTEEEPKQTTGARTLDVRAPSLVLMKAAADTVREPEGDRLFRELKEARDYHKLCTEEVTEACAALRTAKSALDAADKAKEEAATSLRRAKEAFDRAFSPD